MIHMFTCVAGTALRSNPWKEEEKEEGGEVEKEQEEEKVQCSIPYEI